MKQSKLFTKTRKESPKDEVSKNADLLIRAGFVHKEMAGVYSYLPLGLSVLNKISEIIRKHMNAVGGQELLLTVLQDKEVWECTGRWSDEAVDNWFKTKLKNDTELGLGFTHEEEITSLMKDYIRSYKDLPVYAYQIQTKFRNEARAKSGIMRGREFLMKDLYSFSRDEKSHLDFYEKVKEAYIKIFDEIGIGDKTHVTFASGGSFSKYSHEFQTETDAGEDLIHICLKCSVAINEEVKKEVAECPSCKGSEFRQAKAVEVGNIFTLGTRFSDALGLLFTDEDGKRKSVFMGSYGIGPGRLMGSLVELFSDDKGIVWPKNISPFSVHLVELMSDNKGVSEKAKTIYENLNRAGVSVIHDDRDARPGEKFADSDLMGIPYRVILSEKNFEKNELEVVERKTGKVDFISFEELLKRI